METTEAEAMKDVMNLLETEPPSESDHREQLAILVASGNCKEFLGVQLTGFRTTGPRCTSVTPTAEQTRDRIESHT